MATDLTLALMAATKFVISLHLYSRSISQIFVIIFKKQVYHFLEKKLRYAVENDIM